MRSRIRVSLSLWFLAFQGGLAQPADEYFHGGAQHYLSNNIPAALETVTNGLQRFPEDAKLKKLHELLNQQQQQQPQDQKDDPKQDQQKQDEKRQEQKKNEEQKQKESQENKDQAKKDQEKDQAGDKSKAKPGEDKEAGEPQPVAAHAMTPQEAKQMLDAQKDDEQVLIFQPQGEPKPRSKPLKDW